MVAAPPDDAPFPVKTFLKPTAQERSLISLAHCDSVSETPCSMPVQVGFFFDGTNNNQERDWEGKRIGVPDPSTGKPMPMGKRPLKSEECSHSNIVRLFHTYPANRSGTGSFRYYIPGVGTEFEDIDELIESQEGKAFAKGGEARIIWGLLQVLNAIHMAVAEQDPLYDAVEVGQLARAYGAEVGRAEQRGNGKGPVTVMTHRKWFAPHLAKLRAILAAKSKPTIPSLTISVFGFSRGAAQAAAFCHLFDDLLNEGRFAGIRAHINFLGVFDIVATVGGSASMALTLPLPGKIFDGHWSWANRILDPLPESVMTGMHYIAAHELRMNFPVTRLQGNVQEVYFPGVHSDVGGGYAPGEQGKGRGAQAAMLSQIPLLHMYKAAREAGVPLKPFSELDPTVQDDLEVAPLLASAWGAYTAALGNDGGLLKKHMELYYRWRAARLTTLEGTASFHAASLQDQQDLREANAMLAGDLEALRLRRGLRPPSAPEDQAAPLATADLRRINKWHFDRAQTHVPLDDWEAWALAIFDRPEPLPVDVQRFFDDYLHDSFAGFYMAGEVTEFDRRVKVAKVMEKNPEKLSGFDRKVYALTERTRAAQAKEQAGEPLTPEEEALAREAKYGTPYPLMTDDDTPDMRNAAIMSQTATRREGGGYVIRRGYYPHTGFIYRRSIHEDELRARPPSYRVHALGAGSAVPAELSWSDDLQRDVATAKLEEAQRQARSREPASMVT